RVKLTNRAQAPGAFTLPSRGTTVAAVVIVGLVGVVVSGKGRAGAVDLAVGDHGCSFSRYRWFTCRSEAIPQLRWFLLQKCIRMFRLGSHNCNDPVGTCSGDN